METQYQVWLRARHPRTLEIVAEVRVLNLADRLLAERAVETAQSQCQPLVLEILRVHPGALVSAEMHMADALVLRSRHTVMALSDRPSMHNLPLAAAAPAESADDYMRRAARDGGIVQRRNRLGQDVYVYRDSEVQP